MTIFHDEIEIEDFEYDEDDEMYYYPCPCGDRFQISKEELMAGEEVATCPSCSLVVKVIYDLFNRLCGEKPGAGRFQNVPVCGRAGSRLRRRRGTAVLFFAVFYSYGAELLDSIKNRIKYKRIWLNALNLQVC